MDPKEFDERLFGALDAVVMIGCGLLLTALLCYGAWQAACLLASLVFEVKWGS